MAKKEKQRERSVRREAARNAMKEEARAEKSAQKKKTEKYKFNLKDCMKLGRNGNILFVVFIIVCLIYYASFSKFDLGYAFILFEIIAYAVETMAFALFTLSVYWLDKLVRARGVMKILLTSYIVVEVVLMLFEFQLLPWKFYNGLSLGLIIAHAIYSAAVSYSLLMLDPHNKRVELIVAITSIIILSGMFPGIAGYRVYASVLINAIAYIVFFTAMLRQLELEEVNIDCHGDNAAVTTFTSTMFADTPNLVELPQEKRNLKAKAKRLAHSLTDEEKLILTDKDEKFEYEFGTEDDESSGEDDGTE